MDNHILHILGCSAQAGHVLDIAALLDIQVAGIYDPVGRRTGTTLHGHPVLAMTDFHALCTKNQGLKAILCLRDNRLKEELCKQLPPAVALVTIIHPQSIVSTGVRIGKGSIIGAGAIIQPGTVLGTCCTIHAGVIIEHDCRLGDFVNIAPAAVLAGGVQVGDRSTVMTGTTIIPGKTIGSDVTLGAGSLVLDNIPSGVTAYGSPARIKTDRE